MCKYNKNALAAYLINYERMLKLMLLFCEMCYIITIYHFFRELTAFGYA